MSLISDALHPYNLRAFDNIEPPLLTAAVMGTPGSTTYEYCASFKTKVGETTESTTVTVTTGPATLNSTDKIRLTITTIPAAARYIRFFRKVTGAWRLVGDVDVTVASYLDDIGQTTTATTPASTDNSGRPDWYAPLINTGRYAQRMEMIDLINIFHRRLQELGDVTHRDGDIITGLNESFMSGTTWSFTEGMVYVDGICIHIPAGQVNLVGTGTEKVGIIITPDIITYVEDPMLRNLDEGIPAVAYDQPGADELSFTVEWTVDDPLQVTVQEFLDNEPLTRTFRPERTELDRTVARRSFDTSGNFVVRNFPMQAVAHLTDSSKLVLKVSPGKAYPNGFEVETLGTQSIAFNRARDTKVVANGGTSDFSIPGGSTITTNPENYDVDGLKLKITIGSGNAHEVVLSGNGKTAAEVGVQIETSVNAYPTAGELVICTAAGGYLQIKAIDGKNLTLSTVTGNAYAELGLIVGTYTPVGTRIYPINDTFVKGVSDLSYETILVKQVTHNGTTHKDLLLGPDGESVSVLDIFGASTVAADAHDGKWDYEFTTDFVKDGNYISFDNVGGDEPTGGTTYYVFFSYSRNAVKGTRVLVKVTDAPITKGAVGSTEDLTFTGATVTKVIDGSTVNGLSGVVKDAVEILRVNNSTSQSVTEYNAYLFYKNSDALTHDTSTIDWSEAGNPGTGIGGQPVQTVVYYVTFYAWQHVTEGDVVVPDSYDMYSKIEFFDDFNLRDCLDFRTLGVFPIPDENPIFDYEYYLYRADKLTLSDEGIFSLITGTPGNPSPIPSEQSNRLTLAVVLLNPYTYDASDLQIVSLEPIRITQSGLRRLENRIARLEYWNVVNSLEKEVDQIATMGDTRGLFTDALTGLGRSDTAFSKIGVEPDGTSALVTYAASLDQLSRTLRLPSTAQPKTLDVTIENCTHVRRSGLILCLDYQPVVFDEQQQAAITVDCAPDYVYEDYIGIASIDPAVDTFIDTKQLPLVVTDYDDQVTTAVINMDPETFWESWVTNGAGTGGDLVEEFFHGAWAGWSSANTLNMWQDITLPYGDSSDELYGSAQMFRERKGLQISQVPGTISVDLGNNKTMNLSIIPMLRTTLEDDSPFVIQVAVNGLVPNQDHGISIGSVQVDFTYDSTPTHHFGAAGTHTVGGKTTVLSDNEGRLTGKFTVPLGIPCGSPMIEVSHWEIPTHSVARITFYGKGMLQTTQETQTTIGIPNPTFKFDTVKQIQTASTFGCVGDPIAQSFLIKNEIVYVSAVGVYFAAKSATLPITMQIRNMINGFPGQVIYASTTLEPGDITVSADASIETLFTFDHVLGYKPGNEYCFVVVPGSATTEYSLWVAELGAIEIQSGDIIGPPMADGAMFHSPNGRTWEPWTKRDVKYKLYHSNFYNDCQVVFDAISGIQAAQIALAVEEFIAPGTNVIWSYSLDAGITWIPFHPRVNIILEQIVTGVRLRVDVTSLGGSYQIVEHIMGILFLLHAESANYIGLDHFFDDPLELPNHILCTVKTNADGVEGAVANGTGITPMYTTNDGKHWSKMLPVAGNVPAGAEEAFYIYQFETTQTEASITGATNATPIVITSVGHDRQENEVVLIAGVGGNTAANGTRRIYDVTDDTFKLSDPDTGADIAGNGTYTGNGTINLAEFDEVRSRVKFETDNQARTPDVRDIGFVCSKI